MTPTGEHQLEQPRDPRLVSDYTRYWEPNGFSWDAFLRWRKTRPHWHMWNTNDAMLTGEAVTIMGIQEEAAFPINPDWANLWADYFPDPVMAMKWAALTDNPSHAFHMKRLGYREPERAEALYRILSNRDWMPVVESRPEIRFGVLNPDTHEAAMMPDSWVASVISLYLSPTFRFSAGQVKALREVVDFNFQAEGWLHRTTDAMMMTQAAGLEIPDGDGRFSYLLRSITEVHHDCIHILVGQARGDQSRFLQLIDLASDHGPATRSLIGRAVYCLDTGVPMDWVDDAMGIDASFGRLDEVRWMPSAQRIMELRHNAVDFLEQDMSEEARRLVSGNS